MKTYHITFVGRQKSAIGVSCAFTETVQAANEEAAILKLYDKYDHIQQPSITEVCKIKVTIIGCESAPSAKRTEIELTVDADPANAASHHRVRAMYDALKKRYAIVEIKTTEKG
jgi:hypothetical protein